MLICIQVIYNTHLMVINRYWLRINIPSMEPNNVSPLLAWFTKCLSHWNLITSLCVWEESYSLLNSIYRWENCPKKFSDVCKLSWLLTNNLLDLKLSSYKSSINSTISHWGHKKLVLSALPETILKKLWDLQIPWEMERLKILPSHFAMITSLRNT